jgi:hypothetical protein
MRRYLPTVTLYSKSWPDICLKLVHIREIVEYNRGIFACGNRYDKLPAALFTHTAGPVRPKPASKNLYVST